MSTGEAQNYIDVRSNVDGVAVAVWTWDLVTSNLTWSPGLGAIFGVDLSKVLPDIELYKSLVHPDDRSISMAAGTSSQGKYWNARAFVSFDLMALCGGYIAKREPTWTGMAISACLWDPSRTLHQM